MDPGKVVGLEFDCSSLADSPCMVSEATVGRWVGVIVSGVMSGGVVCVASSAARGLYGVPIKMSRSFKGILLPSKLYVVGIHIVARRVWVGSVPSRTLPGCLVYRDSPTVELLAKL